MGRAARADGEDQRAGRVTGRGRTRTVTRWSITRSSHTDRTIEVGHVGPGAPHGARPL